MTIYTIGFTKKTAERFFGLLTNAGVQRVVDIRLNNSSQLAGFAKRDDLRYFLRVIGGIDYVHEPSLSPTQEMLGGYRNKEIDWDEYEVRFKQLLKERQVEKVLDPVVLDQGCLLCSEAEPERCHRRLVVEYLSENWGNIQVQHLE